jgi:serine/threonine-protein kinase
VSGEPLPLERALALVRAAARAVDALHAHQIVHGSLEPSSFQVDGKDGVTLAPPQDVPAPSDLAGRARAHWSPQRRAGEPARPADDLYALGLIARDLLGIVRPAAGAAARVTEMDVVLRAHLSWAPSERFASGAELAQELDRIAARPLAGQEPAWVAARRVAQAREALRLALATPPAHRPRRRVPPAPLPSHPIIRHSNYPEMPLTGRWVAILVAVLCSVYLFPLYFMLFARG